MRESRVQSPSPASGLAALFALFLGLAASGCSDAGLPTEGAAPEASESMEVSTKAGASVISPDVTPSVTCPNGQTFITMCINPDGNAQTVAVHLEAVRKLRLQGARIGPCPGDVIIDPCNRNP